MRRQCRWRRRPHRRCGRAHSPLYHPLRRIPSSAHPGPRQARLRRASRSHAPLVPPLPHPPPRSPLPPMLTTTPRRRCVRPATWPQKPHPAGSTPMDPSPPPLHPPVPPLTQRAASTASCARSGADAPCMSMSKKKTKQKGACGPHTPHWAPGARPWRPRDARRAASTATSRTCAAIAAGARATGGGRRPGVGVQEARGARVLRLDTDRALPRRMQAAGCAR